MSRVSQFIKEKLRACKQRLTQIRDTPHAIAGGVAIGLFIGFTPLLGFKTALAVLVAWLLRCSKLSAALSVAFHDVLLPVWPVILRWQFQVGYFLLSSPHELPPKLSIKHANFERLFSWKTYVSMKTVHLLWPTFIGSVVLATPLAIGAYFLVLAIVTRAQAQKSRQSYPG